MSLTDAASNHPVLILHPFKQQNLPHKKLMAMAESENEKATEEPKEIPIGDSDPDVILVDYEENDLDNPLSWAPMRRWLMVFAISWMGFVR
jgi:hypothetical protein